MVGSCECRNGTPVSIKCGGLACFLPGRATDLSAPLCGEFSKNYGLMSSVVRIFE